MVKKQHKVLSLILCLILAVSAVCAGAVGAFAASGDTIYFKPGHWTEANAWFSVYAWDGNGGNTFVKMTEVESGVYSADLGGSYANVIFCRNNPSNTSVDWSSVWNQTADLTVPSGSNCFAVNSGEWSGASGTWSTYGGSVVTNPTTATTATTATSATTATTATSATTATTATTPVGTTTVYLENEAGWSTPYCYMWNSSTDSNKSWPGVAMTNMGGNVWSYTPSKEYANCIFSNSGSNQTSDLTAKYGYIYNNSTSQWSVYDTSPLQVVSYSYDTDTVYVNADVILSATAQNTSGATVNYKFSVTNASGATSVLADYSSANTATWTPASTGTYTLTFDFIDSDGNSNSRTLSVEVKDDSSLAKPVIKSVLPVNNGLVAVNTAATVNVKAGGGKTGTNLLFYKYVVTNPDGTTNTPYYTLNSSYTFTPSTKGEYKVQVYVQGSDNSTVNKTYTYTAVGEITTTVPVTVPQTTAATFVLGDANGDGDLTIDDATYIQKYLADFDGYYCSLEVCDFDGDGIIIIKDVTEIQKKLAGII